MGPSYPGVPLACAQGHGHSARLGGVARTAPSKVWVLGSCFSWTPSLLGLV